VGLIAIESQSNRSRVIVVTTALCSLFWSLNASRTSAVSATAAHALTGLGDYPRVGGRRRTTGGVVGGLILPLVLGQTVDRTDTDQQLASERPTLDAADQQRRPKQTVLGQILRTHTLTHSLTLNQHHQHIPQFTLRRQNVT